MKRLSVLVLVVTLAANGFVADASADASPFGSNARCDGVWRIDVLPQAIRQLVPEGFSSVAATGDGQVWGIGGIYRNGWQHDVLLHRSPTGSWAVEALPHFQSRRILRVVARQGDVWVLTGYGPQQLLHRDSQGVWRLVAGPGGHVDSTDIALGRPGDVWLVSNEGSPVAHHLVAGTWRNLDLPLDDATGGAVTYGLDSTGPDDAWVSGQAFFQTSPSKLVSWHWNGVTWRREDVLPSPDAASAGPVLALRSGVAYMPVFGSDVISAHRAGAWAQLGRALPATAYVTGVELLGKAATPVAFGDLEGTFNAAFIGRLSGSGAWMPQSIEGPSGQPRAVAGRFMAADGDGQGTVWAVGFEIGGGPLVAHAC